MSAGVIIKLLKVPAQRFSMDLTLFCFIHDGFTALGVADSLIRLDDLDLTSKSLNISNDLLTIV